ncbi:urea ABC transporter [Mesorhizobium sp. M7A.F.Ca.US.006.01.1.1]|uniref:urea ABC transporter substrate-binding protein n=1 Tax=Mesorhizobium sp. M7A.F.Ca.US.006.01.1.1 TaxID=2496707 RepID=UPI000FCAAD8C|nr:ABC transporter substrate-binding protein [Mesorhizobium sp. M7A.F.Ca.US.006.01.1.1]RUZ72655.1 urea ABC transporter [Mesorhizobium sp. M7A.F.Ca.US.006.01.1.1]
MNELISRKIHRRSALKLALAGAATLAMPAFVRNAFAQDGPIKLGCLMDETGPLSLEGKPMVQTTQLAVEDLNAAGGLLGRQIELVSYDTQSAMQPYSQYAQRLALQDKVDVVHGGLTSASREAIRPIFGRAQIPYFYNTLYEGGVCDRNTFCTGTTPAQTIRHLIEYALKNWGKKVYILAADYNFGQITANWIRKFIEEGGGSVAAADFFPLDATNYSSTISRIQSEQPDFLFSVLVGGAQTGFYRQWDAAGMARKIPIASNVFGLSDELNQMDVSTTDGILTSYGWYPNIDTADSNDFVKKMKDKFGSDLTGMSELDACTYEGIMLWAEGVKKAGTLERGALLAALESGLSIKGPSGLVTIDPKTHHTTRPTYLAISKDRNSELLGSFDAQAANDAGDRCDLIKSPDTNEQFEPIF